MMELCRWNDVKKITDDFDVKYERGFYLLKKFVKRFNGKLSRVGNLARSFEREKLFVMNFSIEYYFRLLETLPSNVTTET